MSYLPPEQDIALAISGGPDSICLLHTVQTRWKEQGYNPSYLHILTCDHNTRENIQKEIDLVESVRHGSSLEVFHYAGSNYSEQALRQRRHEQFVHYCNDHNINFLLTGHHLDDRIESTLLNIKRGAGIKGIRSISVSDKHFLDKNITILRPLINWSKDKIISYCRDYSLDYVLDPTNDDVTISERNTIRHLLQKHFHTPQRHESFRALYDYISLPQDQEQNIITKTNHSNNTIHCITSKENFGHILSKDNQSISIIPQQHHDLISVTTGEWTADIIYQIFEFYQISINPRATTLETLSIQLNKQSGNKISYQGLTISAYTYASIIKKIIQ